MSNVCDYCYAGTDTMTACVHTTLYIHYPDFNECDLPDNGCDRDAECVNTEGSYQCTCNTGYTGDGHTCSGESCTQKKRWSN